MGRASAVLTAPRVVAGLALAAALGAYYAVSESLWSASDWWDVAFLALVLIPAAFAYVYLVLPLWSARRLLIAGIALIGLAFLLKTADLPVLANFSKLAAMAAIGFWFLTYFETIAWVVLVACIVPWVDAYSVWRGPTSNITKNHAETFTLLSVHFPVPGEDAGANLGLPDLLFFSLFLAAAARFGLRVRLTWIALVLSFGATLALAVAFDVAGLPALPLLSAGFLLVNADLLWRRLRPGRAGEPASPVEER